MYSQALPLILAFTGQRQADLFEFEVILVYVVNSRPARDPPKRNKIFCLIDNRLDILANILLQDFGLLDK